MVNRIACFAAVIAAGVLAGAPLRAEDYPARPIHAITTSSAGGLSDIFMRALGEELRTRLGQPVIVDNRPGGSQNVGTRACTEAAPDGYTICIINADPLIFNPLLFKHVPFDPEKGLQPITNLFHIVQVMAVNASLNAKTVDELIAVSKAKPGTLSYLTASLPLAVYMETLKKEQGADWVRVPFKGGGDSVNAILSGSTPIGLIGVANVLGHIRSGSMHALVIGQNFRSSLIPNVPSLQETGYRGPPSASWYGLFAPAGTPRPIVERLHKEVTAILNDPAFREKNLINRGLVPALNTPEQFAEEIKRDRVSAQQVVKASGLQPQ